MRALSTFRIGVAHNQARNDLVRESLYGFCLCLLLQGCQLDGVARMTSRQQVLATLKKCLTEVGQHKTDEFVSPCANMQISHLEGIKLANLEEALGPPGISSADYVHYGPDGKRIFDPAEYRWGFYHINGLGGGPELQCVTGKGVTCKQVRWLETE